jgi:hypothetical protein
LSCSSINWEATDYAKCILTDQRLLIRWHNAGFDQYSPRTISTVWTEDIPRAADEGPPVRAYGMNWVDLRANDGPEDGDVSSLTAVLRARILQKILR